MKNTLLITTSIVALVAGANLASAQRVEDTHGAPAAATSSEQKAPEGKMKEQDATKHQKSDSAKDLARPCRTRERQVGRATQKRNRTRSRWQNFAERGYAASKQKEETQLPSKGAAQNTGQGTEVRLCTAVIRATRRIEHAAGENRAPCDWRILHLNRRSYSENRSSLPVASSARGVLSGISRL